MTYRAHKELVCLIQHIDQKNQRELLADGQLNRT